MYGDEIVGEDLFDLGYPDSDPFPAPLFIVVLCRYPTTTRCAQCKPVRYCSSKCQILHWRQGHAKECPSRDGLHSNELHETNEGVDNGVAVDVACDVSELSLVLRRYTPVLGVHSAAYVLPSRKKSWCFVCEFEYLILRARGGESPLSPIKILSRLQKIGKHLGPGKEEDSHEFLRCAVDTMQSVFLKEADATSPFAEETTLVGLTFGGYLHSKNTNSLLPVEMVKHLKSGIGAKGQMVHVEDIKGRKASYVDIPDGISEITKSALKRSGISKLYNRMDHMANDDQDQGEAQQMTVIGVLDPSRTNRTLWFKRDCVITSEIRTIIRFDFPGSYRNWTKRQSM